MSLLTKRQIADILDILCVWGTTTRARDLEQWNEKQPAPIEPNWKKISSKVKTCHLRQYYFDSEGNEIDWDYIFSYERPVTAHPHAALLAKYAEVAARRVDPWVEFEFRVDERGWETPTTDISFYPDFEYRHIGETKWTA